MDDLVQKILSVKTFTVGIILIAIFGTILYFTLPSNNKKTQEAPVSQNKTIQINATKQAPIPVRTAAPCVNSKNYTNLNEALANPSAVCHLNLSNQKLSVLPDDFVNLTNLSDLYLNQNNFTQIPDVIFKLQNLTRLDFANNALSSIPPSIQNLTNLQILNLSSNNIPEVPSGIAQLNNLSDLLLAGNPIKTLPENISTMKYLNNLTLPVKTFNNKSSIDKLQKDLPQTNIRFY